MTFLQGRINGQFIIEGFAASVVIAVGTFGFIIIDHANKRKFKTISKFTLIHVDPSSETYSSAQVNVINNDSFAWPKT